jgi:hypothetical protein
VSERAVIQLASRRDPVKIAKMHAWLVRAWAGIAMCYVGVIPALMLLFAAGAAASAERAFWAAWLLTFIALHLLAVRACIGLQRGLGEPRMTQISSGLSCGLLVVNLILIPVLAMESYTLLRLAGYRSRWWGMSREAIQRIGSNYCPNCLYNLEGLSTHKCPECGQEVRRSAGGTVP